MPASLVCGAAAAIRRKTRGGRDGCGGRTDGTAHPSWSLAEAGPGGWPGRCPSAPGRLLPGLELIPEGVCLPSASGGSSVSMRRNLPSRKTSNRSGLRRCAPCDGRRALGTRVRPRPMRRGRLAHQGFIPRQAAFLVFLAAAAGARVVAAGLQPLASVVRIGGTFQGVAGDSRIRR